MGKSPFIIVPVLLILLLACGGENSTVSISPADSARAADDLYRQKLASLQGRKNVGEILSQGWELEDDMEGIVNNNVAVGNVPFRSFYLSPDSTFVKNPRSYMEVGTWQYDDGNKTIRLKSSEGVDPYKIAAASPTELIVVNKGIGSNTQQKYIAPGRSYKDAAENPYHVSNNRWRIKPAKAESDVQLQKRLKEFLRFYVLFYQDNIARDEKTISFYGLPTCLKWYAGGIYMVKKDKLAENWTDCFYNNADAMKAYELMEKTVTKKYSWPKEKMNWVKKNMLVLEQMYQQL